MDEKAVLSIMAECFGMENRDTILKVALECTEGEYREKVVNFYDGFEATIKRDIAAIKEHGIDYYVNVHAKSYINAGFEPQKTQIFIRLLAEQVVWGDDDGFKDLLINLFSAIRFNYIRVNKKQFVINALKIAGHEPVKYIQGITPEYVKEVRREMEQKDARNIDKWKQFFNSPNNLTQEENRYLEIYYAKEYLSRTWREIQSEFSIGENTDRRHRNKGKNLAEKLGLPLAKK